MAIITSSITEEELRVARRLADFIETSPCMFHAVDTLCSMFDHASFVCLPEASHWDLCPGGAYYTVRNNSSLIAWKIGESIDDDALHFQVAAAHSDSPTFKVKAVPEQTGSGESLVLNVEAYGGMIDYTWFDRPLGIAGRVLVRAGSRIESRLVYASDPVVIIPSLAIHLDGGVNKGFAPQRNVDLRPLFSAGELAPGAFKTYVSALANADPDAVMGYDLFLVNVQEPCIWGAASEFISASRLDDLGCAYVAAEAFLRSDNKHDVSVFCCFDNEEVGSGTKQGAQSTLLRDVLARICDELGHGSDALRRALARSFMVSCDNAHAVHPNHPDRSDGGNNRAFLNQGVAIKEAANQHYCSDAFSRAAFLALCEDAGVPYQSFANRSDMAGGSTLGNLAMRQVSMHGVDMGLPQLAMHSAYETAGARDVLFGVRALEAFFQANLLIDGADLVAF